MYFCKMNAICFKWYFFFFLHDLKYLKSSTLLNNFCHLSFTLHVTKFILKCQTIWWSSLNHFLYTYDVHVFVCVLQQYFFLFCHPKKKTYFWITNQALFLCIKIRKCVPYKFVKAFLSVQLQCYIYIYRYRCRYRWYVTLLWEIQD